MALEEKVIVSEADMANLYVAPKAERHYQVLRDMGLLPLTVKSLTTPQGKALLHFATWVYLSGHLEKIGYSPNVSNDAEGLEHLKTKHLQPLQEKFKVFYNASYKPKKSLLMVVQDSGAFGRTIHAMGVPLGAGYSSKLPQYFSSIADSVPSYKDEMEQRRELLDIIVIIFMKDRLKIKEVSGWHKKPSYLQLNSHPSEEDARCFGREVIDFLDTSLMGPSKKGLFTENDLVIGYNNQLKRWYAKLSVSNEQFGYLALKKPTLLDVKVRY